LSREKRILGFTARTPIGEGLERYIEWVRATSGRLDEGRAHHEALLPLAQALFAEPSPAVIKAVLHAEGRLPTPDVRMPLSGASDGAVRAARLAFSAAAQGG